MKTGKKTRMMLVFSGIFYVMCSAIVIALSFGLQRAVDFAAEGNLNGLITVLVVILAIVIPINFLCTLVAARCRVGFVRDMLTTVKQQRMIFIFMRRPKHSTDDSNKDLSFFSADADILEDSYYSNRARLPLYISQFVFALAAMLWINWIVTVSAIAVSLIPMLISGAFSNGLAKRKKAYSDASAEYVDNVQECISGKKDIVAYDKQSLFLAKHNEKNIELETARSKSDFYNVIASQTSACLGVVVQVVVVGLSAYFVIIGDLTFGFLVAMIQLMYQLLNPIQQIVESVNGMRSARNIIEKANEVPESDTNSNATAVESFNDSLVIENVGISYAEGEYILRDLSLNFRKGGKYAICAPSGYGKSSIAKALALELSEYDGSITLDGHDIQSINTADYRRLLRHVRQAPYLFSGTILNNITFFEEVADKSELENVLKTTRINEFAPDNESLMRQVSDTSGLSGGQKQRIVLARALLHKPQILVLDEITSSVDLKTSCDILSDLFLDKNLTCIVITHETDGRLLALFDEVLDLRTA